MVSRLNIVLMISMILMGCVERFWPESDDYENLLIADGYISNEPPPYTIRLSKTTSIKTQEFNPVANAIVKIHDNNNNVEELEELSPGEYISSENGIYCQVDSKYKVSIQLQDGRLYETKYEQIILSPSIDSVYALYEEKPTTDPALNLQGYQFYIDTYKAEGRVNYYLWKLVETFKFNSDYYINWIWDHSGFREIYNIDTLYTCWTTSNINQMFVYNVNYLSKPGIKKIPLNYVSNETKRLTLRYSLLVKQYVISEDAFNYWDAVIKQNKDIGSLYDKQPFQVQGNTININDQDEVVLGYITIAGVSTKRIFVNKPDNIEFTYPICPVLTNLDKFFAFDRSNQFPLYFTRDVGGMMGLVRKKCIDCTRDGGDLEQPDFWID